jgi:hypothetical protein
MLSELLNRIGTAQVRDSVWTLRGVEAAGNPSSAQELEALSEQGQLVPGDALIELADRGVQVIEGELIGQRRGASEPWILLRGVDSSWWDVETDNEALLTALRAAYPAATPLPR